MLIVMTVLLHADCSQRCFADLADAHRAITVPFTAFSSDYEFTPRQLVTVRIRKSETAPAISATFIFDTGTTHCAITSRFADKLGLPLHLMRNQLGGTLSFIGRPAFAMKVGSLSVGALKIKNFDLVVLSREESAKVSNQPIDGVLGANFWSSFVVHLNFGLQQITFITSAVNYSFDRLGQNPVKLSAAEIARQGFEAALVVPMIMLPGKPYAVASLSNGQADTVDLLLVDSGSNATFVSDQTRRKLNLQTLGIGVFTGIEGQSTASDIWLPSLVCGTLKLSDLLVHSAVQPDLPQSVSILGLDVLANYDVLLDFPHQKMYLKPRADLLSVTSREYDAASPAQRRQWAQRKLIVRYLTARETFGLVVPYDLTPDGLPLAQVRLNDTAMPSAFLLKSSTHNVFISDILAQQWKLTPHPSLDAAGKPLLMLGDAFGQVQLPKLLIGSLTVKGSVAVLPADKLLSWASYTSVPGIIGSAVIFGRPVLMDPATQSWIYLNEFKTEDLAGLNMSDAAAAVDILDPDQDSIPAVAVQEQQGAAQFTDTMTLATGSPFTLLSAEAAKTLHLTPEPKTLSYGAGKDITVFNQAHLSQISIGGVVLKDVEVAYPIGAMPDGFYPRLGMNVISRLRLLVDVVGKKMYVKSVGQ